MMRVRHEFREILVPFRPEVRTAWEAGDKSLIPPGHPVPPDISSQPKNHFPEFFVLDHFRRTAAWRGYRWFAMCVLEDRGSAKYGPGGEALERVLPPAKLAAFRAARASDRLERRLGKGEPDLFLYKEDGSVLFVETKMNDSVDPCQLRCMAQIRSILDVGAEFVRIVPERRQILAKSYSVEIEVPPPIVARGPAVRRA